MKVRGLSSDLYYFIIYKAECGNYREKRLGVGVLKGEAYNE